MTIPEMNIYSPECEAAQKKLKCEKSQRAFRSRSTEDSRSPDPDDHRELSPPIPPPHMPPIMSRHIQIQIEDDKKKDDDDKKKDDGIPELVDAPPVTQKTLEKPVLEKPVHSTKTIRGFFYWMMNQVILIVNIVWDILCGILKIVYDMIMGIFRGPRICIPLALLFLLALPALVWMSYPNSSPPSPSTPVNQSLANNQSLPAPSPPEKEQCKISEEVGPVCTDGGKTAKDHPNCENREHLTGVLYNNHVKSANQPMSNLLKVTGTALAILGSRYLETFAFFQVLGPGQVFAAAGVAAGAYVAQEVTAAYDKHHKENLEKCGTIKMFPSTRI